MELCTKIIISIISSKNTKIKDGKMNSKSNRIITIKKANKNHYNTINHNTINHITVILHKKNIDIDLFDHFI
jgi:hypothetical protein